MKLNNSTLAQIPIDKPSYNRDEIGIGIVHFGVGGFHRAHQAMYVDRLLEMGLANEWGICGVGVLPADRKMADVMAAQDGLYTLLLENPDGSRDARVIGSIVDYRYAPDDPEAVIELLAAPSTRIISLTITEGGYNIDNLGELPRDGVNVFGLVADALARRRDRGVASPTIVSCDNIEGNGDVARQAFTTYAERVHPGLGEWMSTHTRFPNSMVDRITPVTTPDVIAVLQDEFGVEDQWPVAAEPFTSWVLEDDFSDGRPPLEKVDVLLVDDVTPYELMKLRLLNASHQSLCYFAYLAGYRLVHDAAGDPLFAEFLPRIHGFRGHADAQAGAGHRPARLQAHADRTVRQPRCQGHHRAVVLRLVGPHPEMAAAGDQGEPRRGWPGAAVGGHGGQLGAVRRRRRRARRTRSTSRTSSPTRWCRWPGHSARTRPRSSKTPRCSAISQRSRGSSRRTCGRWTRCTATEPARRWRHLLRKETP